jgi:predicted RNA-binding Zn ribbon-like protein
MVAPCDARSTQADHDRARDGERCGQHEPELVAPDGSELLTEDAELARLHQCAGCCWLFLDHSRGAGRRWCSMADCGTEAKKRRYVQRRRERRRQ